MSREIVRCVLRAMLRQSTRDRTGDGFTNACYNDPSIPRCSRCRGRAESTRSRFLVYSYVSVRRWATYVRRRAGVRSFGKDQGRARGTLHSHSYTHDSKLSTHRSGRTRHGTADATLRNKMRNHIRVFNCVLSRIYARHSPGHCLYPVYVVVSRTQTVYLAQNQKAAPHARPSERRISLLRSMLRRRSSSMSASSSGSSSSSSAFLAPELSGRLGLGKGSPLT